MNFEDVKLVIDSVFDNNEDVNPNTSGEVKEAIDLALNFLDKGELRVAEPIGNSQWKVNQWLKKAVLLSFKVNDMNIITGGPQRVQSSSRVCSKAFCLHIPKCCFDAFFCKYRCLCRYWKYD